MKARIIFFLFSVATCFSLFAHEVHMSVSNVEIVSDSNKINYSIGLFYADLQALINHKYNTLIDFKKEVSMTSIEQRAILEYVNTSFILSDSSSNLLGRKFLYWRIDEEMIWLFFCTEQPLDSGKLSIQNTLFLDLYSDQKNYTLIKEGKIEESVEFNKRNTNFNYSIKHAL